MVVVNSHEKERASCKWERQFFITNTNEKITMVILCCFVSVHNHVNVYITIVALTFCENEKAVLLL